MLIVNQNTPEECYHNKVIISGYDVWVLDCTLEWLIVTSISCCCPLRKRFKTPLLPQGLCIQIVKFLIICKIRSKIVKLQFYHIKNGYIYTKKKRSPCECYNSDWKCSSNDEIFSLGLYNKEHEPSTHGKVKM